VALSFDTWLGLVLKSKDVLQMSAHFPLSGKPSQASAMCHLLLSLPI